MRSALLSFSFMLALAVAASGQVYTYGGYATTSDPLLVPPGIVNTVTSLNIPSVPAINTPIIHLGPMGPERYGEMAPMVGMEPGIGNPGMQIQPQAQNSGQGPQSGNPNSFNFGAANYSTNPFMDGGISQPSKSLGEIAREYRNQRQNENAKTYTNSDIEQMAGNGGGIAAAASPNGNTQWPANNGVITPPPNQPQGVIAAPPPAPPVPNRGNSPFAPRTPNQTPPPANTTTTPQGITPQAYAEPLASKPYLMAQNNPENAGIPQQNAQHAGSSSVNHATQRHPLPTTASRLPLLGVLGFVSISMGLFVRYQRTKDTK